MFAATRKSISLLSAVLLVAGCSPYSVRTLNTPNVSVPDVFQQEKLDPDSSSASAHRWWEEFGDENLNRLITTSLSDNLSLQAAWSRLEQAQAQASIVGSQRFPEAEVGASGSRNRRKLDDPQPPFPSNETLKIYENDFVVSSGLSFELDIWKRVASLSTAEQLRASATLADVENTALVLTGSIAELWFRAKEQYRLVEVLEEQLEAGKILLELIELRFSVGRGSALDVYQQRQQLHSIYTLLPIAQSAFEQTLNQLSTLVGLPPGQLMGIELKGDFPTLPPFPELATPADLFETRPDLRAVQQQLQGAEYNVAAAVADRYPRLAIGLSYDFSARDINDLFTNEAGNMALNAALPIIDGGRRRAEVDRQKAVVDELLNSYGDLYLTALQEVENAVIEEKYQRQLVERLDTQLKLSKATLRESKTRYVNGLSDYLDVIIALQALQDLERRVVQEQRGLLVARTRLYRSLGGSWTKELQPSGLQKAQRNEQKKNS